jgi:radical SAM family uncharacterized protein
LADFVDFAMMGEGEEVIREVIDAYKEYKQSNMSKQEFLRRLSHIEGVYVPSLYDVTYQEDGVIKAVTPKFDDVPKTVKKRIIKDFNSVYTPRDVIVPNIKIVHDRVNLEIFRGCSRSCRFCQAGMIYRPVREKNADTLMELAHAMITSSGYDEISLASLSTSDYSQLEELLLKMLDWSKENKISFSIPSQRADKFSKEFMDKIQTVRTSGITFAPEAGTQRLRDVINKNITQKEILNACKIAFTGNNTTVKLYFMSGLPTETLEDIDGIRMLAFEILDAWRNSSDKNPKKFIQINISISAFVPKPFTPFQWVAQDGSETMREKHTRLKRQIKSKKIHVSYSDDKTSFLEAVFSRGDRRLSKVLMRAVNNGCCFDGWGERFDLERWLEAFKTTKISPEFYANRLRQYEEVLPWDHIDIGVDKQFLIRQNELAKQAITTPSCMQICSVCGVAEAFGGGLCG